jgi:16S rRNA (guanine527-N7)-methyltransferase
VIDEVLTRGAKALGIELSPRQVEQFLLYTELLLEWNDKFNLTSIDDQEEIAVKHYIDSLTCLKVVNFPEDALVADIGTGAGFPGVPIAIARPDLRVVLIEATRKKLAFLEELRTGLAELAPDDPPHIELVNARAEEAGADPDHREHYDFVVARAVAEMRVLIEYCLPLVKVGGAFVAMKGPDVNGELDLARPGIGTLGGAHPEITRLTLPYTDINRTLIVINKKKPTPEPFPRHGSKIAKKPL